MSRPAPRPVARGPRLWLLDVPFEDRELAKWGGARWDATRKRWVYRGPKLPDAIEVYGAKPHSWEQWLEHDANGGWQPTPHTPTVTLHPHQRDAVTAIAAARRAKLPGFLLADDVGLGKTYAAVAAVDALGSGLSVLVISPLSVVAHWRRSIDAASNGTNRFVVINYDRLKQLLDEPASAKTAKRKRTQNRRTATQGKAKVAFDVVIVDESHLTKTPTSQRSAAVRQLIATGPAGKRRTPAFTLWLSATAGQNPLELAYLAPLLAARTGAAAADLDDFEAWCRAQGIGVKRGAYGAWSWDRNPADLALMRRLLFEGTPVPGLRRRPTDIAGWPEQQRIAHPVELDVEQRHRYDQAWEEFQAVYANAVQARAAGAKRLTGEDNPLTALLRFRQKASLLRVDATADLVVDLVANDRQVAVSVEFLATADAVIAALAKAKVAAVRITGAEGPEDREANRVAFQQGKVPVVVYTVTEGISLHAGEQASAATDTERVNVLHDPRWSAIATAQIEGRTHRDGRNAVAYHCFAADTVEERVVATTIQRLVDMKTMIGDDTEPLDLLAAVLH